MKGFGMPEEIKTLDDPEEEETPKKKSKLKGPLLLGIIGFGVFVIAIGAFSFFMGVFSSPPAAEVDGEATEDTLVAVDGHGKTGAVKDPHADELDALEAEMFGLNDVGDAEDLDDLALLAEKRKSGMSEKDSIKAAKWLDAEKAAIAIQRAELDSVSKHIARQEYRLKQLVAKTNQMESARINSLAKLYDGMKATQVAPLLRKLTEEQAVEVLLKMKSANAAKILGALNPDHAARISSRMITLTEE
ncbi:MAG: hypothetical protein GY841_12040 [FCB group bacterium]|nr:hypothetical protein [FCB group bacterium]